MRVRNFKASLRRLEDLSSQDRLNKLSTISSVASCSGYQTVFSKICLRASSGTLSNYSQYFLTVFEMMAPKFQLSPTISSNLASVRFLCILSLMIKIIAILQLNSFLLALFLNFTSLFSSAALYLSYWLSNELGVSLLRVLMARGSPLCVMLGSKSTFYSTGTQLYIYFWITVWSFLLILQAGFLLASCLGFVLRLRSMEQFLGLGAGPGISLALGVEQAYSQGVLLGSGTQFNEFRRDLRWFRNNRWRTCYINIQYQPENRQLLLFNSIPIVLKSC